MRTTIAASVLATMMALAAPSAFADETAQTRFAGAVHSEATDAVAAVANYRVLAAEGYVPAMIRLSEAAYLGRGMQKDVDAANEWFIRAASLAFDHGMPADRQAAVDLAKIGVPAAQYFSAVSLLIAADAPDEAVPVAITVLTNAANQGYPDAQFRLAQLLEAGAFVPRDEAAARKWYARVTAAAKIAPRPGLVALQGLAAQGDGDAMFALGQRHQNGFEVKQDMAVARGWYEKAAAAGNADALYQLGDMSAFGIGTARDYGVALGYYRRAAALGLTRAQFRTAIYAHLGLGAGQDEDEALRLLRLAAPKSDDARLTLLKLEGKPIPPADPHPSVAAFLTGGIAVAYARAEAGDPESQLVVADDFDRMSGVDGFEALKPFYRVWATRAATQGLAAAQYGLWSADYENDADTPKHRAALAWLRRAADQGHAGAAGMWAGRQRDTKGSAADVERYFRMTADRGISSAQIGLGLYLAENGNASDGADWLTRAVNQGEWTAATDLARLASEAGRFEDAAYWWRVVGRLYVRNGLGDYDPDVAAGLADAEKHLTSEARARAEMRARDWKETIETCEDGQC